jgi:hypothetical protein
MPTLIKTGIYSRSPLDLYHLEEHQPEGSEKRTRGNSALKSFGGGEDEDRTHDLRIANAALSQLSYPPIYIAITSNLTPP